MVLGRIGAVWLFVGSVVSTAAAQSAEALQAEIDALEARLAELEGAPEGPNLDIGGAARFQYAYRDWDDASKDKGGDLEFDVFRLNLDGDYRNITFSAEYRWYEYMHVVHHAWVGYRFDEDLEARLGVNKVPFGLLPFASHNFFFSSNFYLGLEDDYDSGIKLLHDRGPWRFALAFYKNADWGNASSFDRYSYDIVVDEAEGQHNEETNQLNARAAYDWQIDESFHVELGTSLQYGELYNRVTSDKGDRWAAAVHADAYLNRWNLQLQVTRYEYDPDNPPGVSDAVVRVGAYGYSEYIPAEATSYIANLAYEWPVQWGAIEAVTFYNDFSYVDKDESAFEETIMNVLGFSVAAGPVFTYFDYVVAKNQPFIGGTMADDTDDWNTRFNVNVGYYF